MAIIPHLYQGINESTPKSPYVKNAFYFVVFANIFAKNTTIDIDVLLDISVDFWQSKSIS